MEMTALAESVTWRRSGSPDRCIGTLWASSDGVGLVGADPASRIGVTLWLPRSEIVSVQGASRALAIGLADGTVVVREAADERTPAAELAARLRATMTADATRRAA